MALTPDQTATAVANIAASGAVGEDWAAEIGTGANAANALQVGEDQRVKLLAAMGGTGSDVAQAFDANMSDNIRFAVMRELSNTYTERQPPATADDMAKFVDTEHGALLAADWGSEASRRVATALHRWNRMTAFLTDDEADSLHDHFWRMTAKERAEIVRHLGQ